MLNNRCWVVNWTAMIVQCHGLVVILCCIEKPEFVSSTDLHRVFQKAVKIVSVLSPLLTASNKTYYFNIYLLLLKLAGLARCRSGAKQLYLSILVYNVCHWT